MLGFPFSSIYNSQANWLYSRELHHSHDLCEIYGMDCWFFSHAIYNSLDNWLLCHSIYIEPHIGCILRHYTIYNKGRDWLDSSPGLL